MNVEQYLLNIPSQKIKFGLSRTLKLLQACNNPEKDILSIQIVGTNGKGSVSAFLTKALVDKGYKVGLYTSPHLVNYTERIRINFKNIDQNSIKIFINQHREEIEKIQPSFFELMTVISVWYFNQNNVDIAILETGLGGRLDSVTACNNKYVLFSSISLDHEDILGRSIEKITTEKSGAILNNQQICISLKQSLIINKILTQRAIKTNNKINFISKTPLFIKNLKFKYLKGEHQKQNAFLAYKTIKELQKTQIISISWPEIKNSFQETTWPGRFQIIQDQPTIIYDVAHNKEGLEAFIKTFNHLNHKKRKILILGFESNKQINKIVGKFKFYFDRIICTETNIRKSMPAEQIFNMVDSKRGIIIQDVTKAIKYALSESEADSIISIVGSHFFAPYINNNYQNCFAIDK